MQNYKVTYALSTDPDATATSAFSSASNCNSLEMVVQAISSNQACMIVESMFGGRIRCQAKMAFPV